MNNLEDDALKKTEGQNLLHNSKEPILSAEELIKVYNISLERKSNPTHLNSVTDSIGIDTGEELE